MHKITGIKPADMVYLPITTEDHPNTALVTERIIPGVVGLQAGLGGLLIKDGVDGAGALTF